MLGAFITTTVFMIASTSLPQVTASSLSDALQIGRLRLHPRQANDPLSLNDFPIACQTTCAPAIVTANDPNCQTLRCECTVANTQALETCLACVVVATNGSPVVAQASVDSFISECTTNGFPITGISSIAAPASSRIIPTTIRSVGVPPTNSATTSARFSPSAPDATDRPDVTETPTVASTSVPQRTVSPSNTPSGLPALGNGAFVPRARGVVAILVAVMPVALL